MALLKLSPRLNSLFAFLRYINIFSYINYFPVFTKYFNVSVFGYVISGNEASCIMLLIFCLIFPSVIVCLAQKQYPVNSKKLQFAGINMCKEKLAWLFSGGNLFMKEAKKLLREKNHSITQISELLGYSSIHIFSRAFKKAVGLSPTAYIKSII